MIDLSHDHGVVVDGVAVYTVDGDRQAFPGKPHFRVRTASGSQRTTWISGKGYALSFKVGDLHHYAKIVNGRESRTSFRFPSSQRSPRVFEDCNPDVFDCGLGSGDTGGGWDWPTGCGDDGNQSCVKGCPDYSCTGPPLNDGGEPYCGVLPDGTCSDTILVRWSPGMWSPQGGLYMGDLICTLQLSTFDMLCAESGPNSPRNWPPVVSLFYRYDAAPSSGRLLCNAWDHSANAVGAGWNSVTGRQTLGARFLSAGVAYAWTLSWTPPTIPNSSGIGAQYFPTPLNQLQTANCSGQGSVQ